MKHAPHSAIEAPRRKPEIAGTPGRGVMVTNVTNKTGTHKHPWMIGGSVWVMLGPANDAPDQLLNRDLKLAWPAEPMLDEHGDRSRVGGSQRAARTPTYAKNWRQERRGPPRPPVMRIEEKTESVRPLLSQRVRAKPKLAGIR